MYLANEVSSDTRALIEKYLETDSELALIAQQSSVNELLEGIPLPLTQNNEMKAYKKTKVYMFLYIVIIAVVIAAVLGGVLMMFLISA